MHHDEKKLKKQLQEMRIGHEARKAQRKAAKLRRAAFAPDDEPRFDGRALLAADEDALADFAPPTRVRGRTTGERPRPASVDATLAGRLGTVSGVFPGSCRVLLDGHEHDCRLAPDLAVAQRSTIAVGDAVRVSERGDARRVEEVLPRRTALARPDPSNPHLARVLAANVEVIVIATAVRAPGVKPGLIDRVLLAASAAGCDAVVCVNKIDLVADDAAAAAELALLESYRERGVAVVRCSAKSGEGIERLRAAIGGRSAVLVGQSGCGKTSLRNALAPGFAGRTAGSRASDGKGRHTTTASSLHPLPSGGFLIDTPGVRQFGLWDPDEDALRAAFADVFAAAEGCRFRDCRHGAEPDCAVRAAIERGSLAAARLASLERLRGGG